MGALRFPKTARLTSSAEFSKVRAEGKAVHGRFIVLSCLRGAEPGDRPARIGLIASRKTGGAVQRNRIRRRLREIVRVERASIEPGCWVVLIARKAAVDADFISLKEEWLRLARRAGILIAR